MTATLAPADLTTPCPHEDEALAAVARVLAAQAAAGLLTDGELADGWWEQ